MPGSIIKHYRELKGLSQKYVALHMKISQNAYSKIENNITQLTVKHVKQLARILDVPVTELLKDSYEIHKPAVLHGSVSKNDLLHHIDTLRNKLQAKHAARHDAYMIAFSMIAAAENALGLVH
ncbi:MAG TPA: helix-turn-helix transcriptional regulator [Chitinophagaceae bacterium]|nr:helix-turn-helix transcriptional regulator [Chitinophagaceae bacterium]